MTSIGADFFDGDEEFLEEQQNKPLTWRGDASYSDWTVIIESNKQETKYSVHRAILGVGPRSSMYFSTLFGAHHFKEQEDGGVSRILLEEDDALVFEDLLDYLYEGTLNASTDNAVALRSLARYFQCSTLLKDINGFIQKDLSITTAPLYLKNAWQHSDTKLEESSKRLILKHFESIDDHALEILPTPLFCSLWKDVECDNHLKMSRAVYHFFQQHAEARTATLLSELTKRITHIDVQFVSGFLEMLAQLDPHKQHDGEWLALDHLCKKCADSLVTDWRCFDTELCVRKFLNPSVRGDFRGTGRIAVRLMGASIELAKADYTRVLERNHQLQAAQERLSLKIDEQKDRITLLEKSARLAKDSLTYKDLEIAGLKIGIDKHKSRINQLEEQVLKLEEELRVATSAVAPPKATPKKRVGWSSSLS